MNPSTDEGQDLQPYLHLPGEQQRSSSEMRHLPADGDAEENPGPEKPEISMAEFLQEAYDEFVLAASPADLIKTNGNQTDATNPP